MRRYQLGAHTKTDLKVHLIWIPKYRKRVLTGPVAVRARDVLRQIALEHELDIITAKWPVTTCTCLSSTSLIRTSARSCRGSKASARGSCCRSCPSEEAVLGRHFWARGYLAVSSGNITDEMIQQYMESQEGEPLTDDSRFTIGVLHEELRKRAVSLAQAPYAATG